MAGKNIMREIGETMEKIFYKKKEPKPMSQPEQTATPAPATTSLPTVDTVRLDAPYKDYAIKAMENGEKPLSKEEWVRNMREGR